MAWGRINEHRKNLLRRLIKVINNAKSIDEKTRVKSFIPIPWLYEFYFPFLWVLLSFNKWYVISIIKHGAHWQEKLCRKSYKSHARLDSYASLHGLNSKEWEGPIEQNYGLYLRSGANLIVFFLAISLPMCSNWLFRLTPKKMSLAAGYTVIFHEQQSILSLQCTRFVDKVLLNLRLFFNLSNNDSCSPKHWPYPARTRKLRKSVQHTL